MKKKIGISYTETNFQNYWNWFDDVELQEIELVELSYLKNNVGECNECDAFILTGGVDIDPSFYGGDPEYDNKPNALAPERDIFEEKIYKYSQENQKPLLGICRGLQLVNVIQGGRLIQDLNADRNARHRRAKKTDRQHKIKIEKDTLLIEIARSDAGKVNSAHHQAIDPHAIGENLIINAHDDSEEKLIEGIEFKDKTNKAFMLCVQWHPERMRDQQSVLSNGIKVSFLKAVKNSIEKSKSNENY